MNVDDQEHSENEHLKETQSSVFAVLLCIGVVGTVIVTVAATAIYILYQWIAS